MMTFGEWATQLERSAIRAKNELEIPTEIVMKAAEEAAKAAIGTYTYGWKQLAESTQTERASLGYPPNEPLLREGDLRNSIESQAELTMLGAEGVVGSSSMIAVYQEMGTSRGIPPRSFLGESLMRSIPLIDETFGKFAVSLLSLGRSIE
jgi:hypothetical protein